LGQIQLLEEQVQTTFSFHPSQRRHFIHLCGRTLQALFTDPLVRQWNIDYLSGLHGPGKISGADAATLFWLDRPADMDPGEFERRLDGWLKELVSIPEGQAFLKASLAEVKAELQERREVVAEREAIDLELAVQEAMVSVNADCMRRLRYRRESERGQQAAMRLLHQLQRMRLLYGEALGTTSVEAATEAGTGPAAEPPAPPPDTPAAGSEVVHRTEAAASQVAGGPASNNEPRTSSTVNPTIGRSDVTPERKTEQVVLRFRPGPAGYEVLRE
jgi:hypothetical protein